MCKLVITLLILNAIYQEPISAQNVARSAQNKVIEDFVVEQQGDRRAIMTVRSIDVSKLDRSLPNVPLANWLKSLLPPSSRIKWEVNDCGEQDGSGRQSNRDIPICVTADVSLPDKKEMSISVNIGTHQKGIKGNLAISFIYFHNGNKDIPVDELAELPSLVRK